MMMDMMIAAVVMILVMVGLYRWEVVHDYIILLMLLLLLVMILFVGLSVVP